MTKLEPGKRYRVTFEGVASEDGDYLTLTPGGPYTLDDELRLGCIELLPDPLPTRPGSVVRVGLVIWMCSGMGGWVSEDGDRITDESMSKLVIDETLFDAGASRD